MMLCERSAANRCVAEIIDDEHDMSAKMLIDNNL
jgi:hypothetical protein